MLGNKEALERNKQMYVPDLSWLKRPVPPFKAPDKGAVIRVSNVPDLMSAVAEAQPGTTIVLAEGEYQLDRTVVLEKEGLTLMGESPDRSKVVLIGDGFNGDRPGPRDQALMVQCATGITIANLTIKDCSTNGISVQAWSVPTPHGLHIYNVAFYDIGQRCIKVNGSQPTFDHIDDGVIEFCHFEQTQPVPPDRNDGFGGNYIGGIDAHRTKNWIIRDNVFLNIRGASGSGRGAIFVWYDSVGTIIERNFVFGCDRGIALGNPMVLTGVDEYWYLTDGIVRNNFICAPEDKMAMEIVKVRGTRIYNNTIFCANPSYNRCVYYAHPTTTLKIANNLVHGQINSFEGAKAELEANMTEVPKDWFVDPANGDLRLTDKAKEITRKGIFLEEVSDDFFAKPRTKPYTVGAYEG